MLRCETCVALAAGALLCSNPFRRWRLRRAPSFVFAPAWSTCLIAVNTINVMNSSKADLQRPGEAHLLDLNDDRLSRFSKLCPLPTSFAGCETPIGEPCFVQAMGPSSFREHYDVHNTKCSSFESCLSACSVNFVFLYGHSLLLQRHDQRGLRSPFYSF